MAISATRIEATNEPPTDPVRAADDDDDEAQNEELAADPRMRLAAVERHHRPAQTSKRGAGHEHGHEQPVDAIAERLDHLAILDAGANEQADPGAVEDQHFADEHRKPDQRRQNPIFSIAASPSTNEPSNVLGRLSGICAGPNSA